MSNEWSDVIKSSIEAFTKRQGAMLRNLRNTFTDFPRSFTEILTVDPIAKAAVQIAGNKFTCVGCDAKNLTPHEWATHLFQHKIFSYICDSDSKLQFVCCCGHTEKEALAICRHVLSFDDLTEHVAPYLTIKALAEM